MKINTETELYTYDPERSCIEIRKADRPFPEHTTGSVILVNPCSCAWCGFTRDTGQNTAERFSSLTAGDGDDYSRTRQVWQEEVRIVHPWWYNSIRRFCTIGCSRAGTDEPIITVQRFADHVHLAHPYTWMLGPGAALVKGKWSHKVMVVDAGCSQCGFGNLASSSGQNPTFWRSDNRRRKFTDSFAKLRVY